MKLPRFSTKPKKRKLLFVHRVVGGSMAPALRPGAIVLAVRTRRARPGDIVILWHQDRPKLKRIQDVKNEQIFVVGDNRQDSTDSRDFGWLPQNVMLAKVIWPRTKGK